MPLFWRRNGSFFSTSLILHCRLNSTHLSCSPAAVCLEGMCHNRWRHCIHVLKDNTDTLKNTNRECMHACVCASPKSIKRKWLNINCDILNHHCIVCIVNKTIDKRRVYLLMYTWPKTTTSHRPAQLVSIPPFLLKRRYRATAVQDSSTNALESLRIVYIHLYWTCLRHLMKTRQVETRLKAYIYLHQI